MNKGEVKVYGASWCPFCQKVEEWLKVNNINYKYLDIETEENNEEFKKQEVTGIPLIIIQDDAHEKKIEGFNKVVLEKYLLTNEKDK